MIEPTTYVQLHTKHTQQNFNKNAKCFQENVFANMICKMFTSTMLSFGGHYSSMPQLQHSTALWLTHWPLGYVTIILKVWFSYFCYGLNLGALSTKLLSGACHKTQLISQHWFRHLHGTVRQQAITWPNVDPDLCRYTVSPGHNDSNYSGMPL